MQNKQIPRIANVVLGHSLILNGHNECSYCCSQWVSHNKFQGLLFEAVFFLSFVFCLLSFLGQRVKGYIWQLKKIIVWGGDAFSYSLFSSFFHSHCLIIQPNLSQYTFNWNVLYVVHMSLCGNRITMKQSRITIDVEIHVHVVHVFCLDIPVSVKRPRHQFCWERGFHNRDGHQHSSWRNIVWLWYFITVISYLCDIISLWYHNTDMITYCANIEQNLPFWDQNFHAQDFWKFVVESPQSTAQFKFHGNSVNEFFLLDTGQGGQPFFPV